MFKFEKKVSDAVILQGSAVLPLSVNLQIAPSLPVFARKYTKTAPVVVFV